MRLAIIADIHGNYQALQAVLADIALMGADRIFSLGRQYRLRSATRGGGASPARSPGRFGHGQP